MAKIKRSPEPKHAKSLMNTGFCGLSWTRHNVCYATLHGKTPLLSRRERRIVQAMTDNILLTVAQIVDQFEVSAGAGRAWIASGRLVPIRREGRGRSGTMYFARGDVGSLVYGVCPVCCGGFKRATIKQKFCSRSCRQKFNRRKGGS